MTDYLSAASLVDQTVELKVKSKQQQVSVEVKLNA